MHLRFLIAVFAVANLGTPSRSSDAAEITYSWSGTIGRVISLTGGKNTDPWMLGEKDLPFVLEVKVSSDEVDIFDQNVKLTGYPVSDATLTLNGGSVNYVGSGILDFDDGISLLAPLADIIVFTGDFQRFGNKVELSFVAAVDATTFRFAKPAEPLPIFNSTTTVFRSGSGGNGPYGALVEVGTPVVVIPEPGGMVLLLPGVISRLLWTRMFR